MRVTVTCALLGVALLAAQNASGFSKPPDLAAEYATSYNMNPAHTGAVDFSEPFAPPFTKLWDVQLGGQASYPLIAEGNVYVVSGNIDLFAFDLATGTQKFEHALSVWNNLGAYDAGQLFYVNQSGTMVALDAQKGRQKWAVQLPNQNDFNSPPIAVNGRVYVSGAGFGGDVYSVDQATGKLMWDASGMMTGGEHAVAYGQKNVYYNAGCQFYAFDAENGSLSWLDNTGCSSSGNGTTYYKKHVYMPTDFQGNSVLKAKNGALTGTFPGNFAPSIFAIGKRKYMLSVTYQDGTVYCTGLNTGNVAWKFQAPNIVFTPAVYANGYVMIGDYSGNVFVLNAKTGAQVWTTTMSHPVYNIAAGQGAFVVTPATNTRPISAKWRSSRRNSGAPSHLPVVLRRAVDRVLRLGDEFVDLGLAHRQRRGAHHRVADRAHDEAA